MKNLFPYILIFALLCLPFLVPAQVSAQRCFTEMIVTAAHDTELPKFSNPLRYTACASEIIYEIWFTRNTNNFATHILFGMDPNYFAHYYNAIDTPQGLHYYTGTAHATTLQNHQTFIDKLMSDRGGDFDDLKLRVSYSSGTPTLPPGP